MDDESRHVTSTDLSDALQELIDRAQAPQPDPPFRAMLAEHFGSDPAQLPAVRETFKPLDHPNLQVALDTYLAGDGRSADVVGVSSPHKSYMGIGLSELIGGRSEDDAPTIGPVEYASVDLGDGQVQTCIRDGLVLIRDGRQRLAALVSVSERGSWPMLNLEVLAPDRAGAERFLADMRHAMKQQNVYRGATISLSQDVYGPLAVALHPLPHVARERIVLPAGVLERIERHTIGFTRHSEKLLAAGRHLKRGILLHGPPGTGKTFTAMYLAGQMSERTTLLVTGRGQGLLQEVCSMARALQPAMVVLEDVDLVAEERTHPEACTVLLFDLLNEMDGLAEDVDVVFVLTTNRPDLLEPALASRPGRIDQAIEIPLPDEASRLRLLELYSEGLDLGVSSLEPYVARTEGASGAFIKELLRKAALFAADEKEALIVDDRHVDEALHELLVEGGVLTKSLLGANGSGV